MSHSTASNDVHPPLESGGLYVVMHLVREHNPVADSNYKPDPNAWGIFLCINIAHRLGYLWSISKTPYDTYMIRHASRNPEELASSVALLGFVRIKLWPNFAQDNINNALFKTINTCITAEDSLLGMPATFTRAKYTERAVQRLGADRRLGVQCPDPAALINELKEFQEWQHIATLQSKKPRPMKVSTKCQ